MAKTSDTDGVITPTSISGTHHGKAYFDQLRRNLRWRLLVAYITPLLLLSVYFFFQYNATLREGIDNHLRSAAEHQRNTVDLFLQERVANLRGTFRTDGLALPPAPEFMDKVLAALRQESPTFVDVGLFQPDGALISYAGPHSSLLGKDYSGESWFRQLDDMEKGFVISDVYLGFRNKPHFIIAVRRTIENQHWTLRASVDPTTFGEFVGSSYLFEDAEAFIVNNNGQRQTLSGARFPEPAHSHVPSRTSETQVTEVEVRGQKYLRALAWLTENDWALVVRVPTSKAYTTLVHARLVLLGIMLVALFLIIVFVFRSTTSLVTKLEVADTAKEDLRLQLFNAAKLASVGEMAAGIAHEINNPLAIIYEEAGMMKDIMDPQFHQDLNPDDFLERLEAIEAAAMRGRSITRNLLAFARRHDSTPERSDMNLLLNRVLAARETDLSLSNIEVVRDFSDDPPWVMVNRNQIDQVILNLLNNAKDAMKAGGRISIRTRSDEKWVRIDVEDSGCGMAPDVMENVFFPFFTTKEVGKGTGLGLSISHGIVESFGGRITVKSEAGTGTTFTILLPVETGIENDAPEHVARGENVRKGQ